MKVILYSTEAAVIAAQQACEDIPQAEVRVTGEDGSSTVLPSPPYTTWVKHPTEDQWALIADAQVEALLGTAATEPDASWYPPRTS